MRNRKSVFPLVCLVSLIAVLVTTVPAFAQYGDPQSVDQGQQQPDPPTRAARLSYLRGTVSLEPNGAPDWSQAVPNYPISSGDRLYTDQDGRAELELGNSAIRMDALTDLTLTGVTDNFLQLGLASGSIHLRVYGLNPGDSQEIDTPNGSILVSQPGDVRINSYPANGASGTVIEVFSGAVQLTGPDLNQMVYAGMAVELSGANPIYSAQIEFPGEDGFDAWSLQRDRRILESPSARYVSRQMPGYDDLDQYGDWDPNVPEYGPVWYPRDVPYGWTPYSTGYWAQVGPWGWTWVDTTGPWGYAPFHYGRWAQFGDRWGWVPGPVAVAPVYSPALVAFAGGGGFSIGISFGGGGLAAWFPLGPRDPYIPWYHCSDRYVTNVNITNVTVVNRTYITNVVNNYNVNHTTINTIHYANVGHVVAVPAGSFAGKPIHGSEVKLTPQQVQNVRPVAGVGQVPVREPARPVAGQSQAGYRPIGLQPSTRPVAAPVARPNVITPRGMSSAAPGAVAHPVPKGVTSVNNDRPAPRPEAVTGNKPMPAAQPSQVSRPVQQPPVERPQVDRPAPAERAAPAAQPQREQPMQQQKAEQQQQKTEQQQQMKLQQAQHQQEVERQQQQLQQEQRDKQEQQRQQEMRAPKPAPEPVPVKPGKPAKPAKPQKDSKDDSSR